MLKILTIICILASVLAALVLMSWLKSKRGQGEKAALLYSILKSRNASFGLFQIPPVVISTAIFAVVVGVGTEWTNAAAYAFGAVICIAAMLASSGAFVNGSASSFHAASSSDIPASVKCSYRSGAIVGFIISAAGLLLLATGFLNIHDIAFINFVAPYALGVSTTAVFLYTGGYVYSSAYARAVPDNDFTDVSGFMYGSGADLCESYVLAGAAAIMLAELAVVTSGVTSTFTADAAAKYPLIVYASGIIASIIGTMIYRGGLQKRPAGNPSVSCIIAGIITAAASIYFSNYMMQSLVYSFATISGILAGILAGVVSILFSSDSKIMLSNNSNDKKLGKHANVVFNAASGMISTAIYVIIVVAAMYVSFNFASYYGIALCAVGFCSITACLSAVTGLAIFTKSSSDIISAGSYCDNEEQDETLRNDLSDILSTASVRANAIAKSYSAIAGLLSAASILSAIFYLSDSGSINYLSEKSISVLLGSTCGVASVFLILGLIILAVRASGTVAVRNMGRSTEEGSTSSLRGSFIPAILSIALPAMVGLFFGFRVLFGFLAGAVCAGYILITAINNSGRHFENTAAQSLTSIIKMMVVFSAVFMFTIINIGGFIH